MFPGHFIFCNVFITICILVRSWVPFLGDEKHASTVWGWCFWHSLTPFCIAFLLVSTFFPTSLGFTKGTCFEASSGRNACAHDTAEWSRFRPQEEFTNRMPVRGEWKRNYLWVLRTMMKTCLQHRNRTRRGWGRAHGVVPLSGIRRPAHFHILRLFVYRKMKDSFIFFFKKFQIYF